MLLRIPQVLSPDELAHVRERLAKAAGSMVGVLRRGINPRR